MSTNRVELKDDSLDKVAGGAWTYKRGVFTSNEFTGSYTIPAENKAGASQFLLGDLSQYSDQQVADILVRDYGAVFSDK